MGDMIKQSEEYQVGVLARIGFRWFNDHCSDYQVGELINDW